MPQRELSVSDSVVVLAVDPVTVWEQVADPTQMPRWSPENTGATTAAEARPLTEGEEFRGSNRRGRARWSTACVVRRSVPGERFCFDVVGWGPERLGLKVRVARWDYAFEAVDGGTRVTETWTDGRKGWPAWAANAFDKVAAGRPFADYQRGNIARTLRALKADLEQAGQPG